MSGLNAVKEAIRGTSVLLEPINREEDGAFVFCTGEILDEKSFNEFMKPLRILRAFGNLRIEDDPREKFLIRVYVEQC